MEYLLWGTVLISLLALYLLALSDPKRARLKRPGVEVSSLSLAPSLRIGLWLLILLPNLLAIILGLWAQLTIFLGLQTVVGWYLAVWHAVNRD